MKTFACPACGFVNKSPQDVAAGRCIQCNEVTGRPTGLDVPAPDDITHVKCPRCDGRGDVLEDTADGKVVERCYRCEGWGVVRAVA